MSTEMQKNEFNQVWYWYMTGQGSSKGPREYERIVKRARFINSLLPGDSRCFECSAPFTGAGSAIIRAFGIHPSSFSPHLCNLCEQKVRELEAGAEVELSLLFADVRGSTSLAASIPTEEFKSLIQKFYQAASDVLVEYDGWVNRLMGDQVIGLFTPRFAGSRHASVAIDAAQALMGATGHQDPQGPWIPVGVGVHTGTAYVGAVGTKNGVNEIAVLGSAPNLTARLSSAAADGEILISQAAADSAGLAENNLPVRDLELKGMSESVPVRVLRVDQAVNAGQTGDSGRS